MLEEHNGALKARGFASAQVDERFVTQLLPFVMEGLKASAPDDYRGATYMVVMRLVSLSSPAPALQEGGVPFSISVVI